MKNNELEAYRVEIDGEVRIVAFEADGRHARLNGERIEMDIVRENVVDHYSVLADGESYLVSVEPGDGFGSYRVHVAGYDYNCEVISEREAHLREHLRAAGVGKKDGKVTAPMPGLIVKLVAEEGSQVKAGQGVLVMEAMKMENEIKSPSSGILRKYHIKPGQAVEKGQVLFEVG